MSEKIYLVGVPYEGIKRELGAFTTLAKAEKWIEVQQAKELEADKFYLLSMTESDVCTYWRGVRPTLADLYREEYIVVSVNINE